MIQLYFDRSLLLICFLLCIGNVSLAQLLDEDIIPSENRAEKPIYSHQYYYLNSDEYYFIDTTFKNLQWYHQWNNANRDLFDYSVLSNMGGALNPLTTTFNSDIWSSYGLKSYEPYFTQQHKVPFYYTKSALTEANYWMGYQRGQNFKIYHTQNINKYWNFLVQYKRLNSLGYYRNNNNKQANFLINSSYNNPKKGYEAAIYFASEKLENQEFGGILNDSLLLDGATTAKALYEVNLESDSRILRNRELFFTQKVKLARVKISDIISNDVPDVDSNSVLIESDSTVSLAEGDSEGQIGEKAFFAIGHDFKYTRRSDVYVGNSTGFYDNYLFVEGETFRDSSSYKSWINTAFIEGVVGQKTQLAVRGGIRSLITEYAGHNYSIRGSNIGVVGEASGSISDIIEANGSLDYIASGPLKESIHIYAHGKLKIWKGIHGFASYRFVQQNPDFFKQYYISNNFIWDNSFSKEINSELSYGLGWGKGNKLQLSNYSYGNYTYFDSTQSPNQSNTAIRITKIALIQNFTFWNFIHLDNKIYYQTTTDAQQIMPLPELVTRNAFYFEFKMFKGALKCLWGGEVKYFSSYLSPKFSSATGYFYIPNQRVEIGNYPIIDVFAGFKIKKAQVYLKYEHINQAVFSSDYFAASGYPFNDRVLRVGISWRFFN